MAVSSMSRLVRTVQRRMRLDRGVRWMGAVVFWGLWTALLLVLAAKVVEFPAPVWPYAGAGAAAAVALAFVAGLLRPVTALQAALLVDERMRLRERLSTALVLQHVQDPFVEAVRRDAERQAARIRAADVQPIGLPRNLRRVWIPVVLVAGLWFVPPLTWEAEATPQAASVTQVMPPDPRAAERLKLLAEQVQSASDEATRLEFEKLTRDLERQAEQIRQGRKTQREALAELADVREQLERNRDQLARRIDAARAVKPLDADSPLQPVQEAMKAGDFSKAANALAALKSQLEQGKLGRQEQAELAKTLAELSQQLEGAEPALADALGQMSQSLSQSDLAKLAEALAQANENLMSLSETMKQFQMLDQLSAAASQCAAGMCQNASGTKPCKGGSCPGGDADQWSTVFREGPWSAGDSQAQGLGFGGPGIGRGGQVPFGEGGPTGFQPDDLKGPMSDKGEIIGVLMVKGEQVPGEARVQLSEAVLESRQQAAETILRETVPLGFRRYVQQYFDAIDPQAAGREEAPPVDPGTEHASPSGDGADPAP